MKRVLLSLMVGSIALTTVFQERAIAASNEEVNNLIQKFAQEALTYARSYRDSRLPRQKEWVNAFKASWAKSDSPTAQFLGDWSAIEESKKIYPSKTKGKVCIIDTFLSRSGLGYEFSQGEIKNNRVYTNKDVVLFLVNTNKGKILGTIFKRRDNGQLGTYGYANPKPLANPSQVNSTANDYDNVSKLAPQFNAAGCTTEMYEGAIAAKPIESTPLIQDLVRQLRKRVQDFESSTTGAKAGYIKDRRSPETKQTLNSFVTAWKKVDINSAPFFGSWSDYDGRITICPSTQKGRVCVLQTDRKSVV